MLSSEDEPQLRASSSSSSSAVLAGRHQAVLTEVSVVTATVSKTAHCAFVGVEQRRCMCLVNPPRGGGIIISVPFPAGETQMLPVKGCGLHSTLEWMQRLSGLLHLPPRGISYLLLLLSDYTAGGWRAQKWLSQQPLVPLASAGMSHLPHWDCW